MENQEIEEGLNALRPLVCDEFRSVEDAWKAESYLDLRYIYAKWDNSKPQESKEKAKAVINFLMDKLSQEKLIILD